MKAIIKPGRAEWIENPEGDYDKQDCELKAFSRLAEKLKNAYPRLEICIVADGLYPNKTFFIICRVNKWSWIVTFKDGNIPTVWEDVRGLQQITKSNTREEKLRKGGKEIRRKYTWINDVEYGEFVLNWFECVEEIDDVKTRFVYLSDLHVEWQNVLEMTKSGRMRWKIENEGFNIQKNHGYGLKHKYSRVSMLATKNYYQCMQIAHMINQFVELGLLLKARRFGKKTIKHLWKKMLGEMRERTLSVRVIKELQACRIQIRFS